MHDDSCCSPDEPAPSTPVPSRLTRRHVLTVGAAVGGTVVLRGLPALGQEGDTGHASSDTSSTSSTSTTSTTTTTPTTTAPPSTIAAPPPITEPAHPDTPEVRSSGQTRGFGTLLEESPNRGIMFPVYPNSATSWTRSQDTYGDCRSGCSRRHQGEDLMAPKMTKLLAVKSGTVVELRHRRQEGYKGGNSLYIKGDDGWFYCYLHINNDSGLTESASDDNESNRVDRAWGPGLRKFATSATTMNETAARGYRVREGEILAYCGDSGNAEDSGSHLHFEIRKPVSSNLWDCPSVNPRESLRGAKPAKVAAIVPPETFRPWNSSTAFITAQFEDFLGRRPSAADLAYYGEMLDYGSKSPDWLMQYFLESREGDSMTQAIGRLYLAFYRRLPDTAGFNYWLDARRTSWSLRRISDQFAKAPEFIEMYGPLDNGAYIDRLYENVLGRAADAAGKQYWLDQLAAGVTRGRVMLGFSESGEYKDSTRTQMDVVGCYGVMYNRVPTSSELTAWMDHIDGGGSNRNMITMLRMDGEYATAANA